MIRFYRKISFMIDFYKTSGVTSVSIFSVSIVSLLSGGFYSISSGFDSDTSAFIIDCTHRVTFNLAVAISTITIYVISVVTCEGLRICHDDSITTDFSSETIYFMVSMFDYGLDSYPVCHISAPVSSRITHMLDGVI